MRRPLAIAAGAVAVLLLVAELAAVPLTTRLVAGVLERCGVGTETFAVTAVDRPVVPRLLVGRARGVELTATGVTAGDLRVESARLRLPEAVLPWAFGDPGPTAADLDLTVTEDDLEVALRAVAPLGVPVTVALDPGVLRLGAEPLPVTVDLAVELAGDGSIRIDPVAGDVALLDRLGIDAQVDLPPSDAARLTALTLADGEVSGTVRLTVVPGVGDGRACEEPIA